MLRHRVYHFLLACALPAGILGACGDEESAAPSEPTLSPVFAPTAGPRPTIEGSSYTFPARGYAVAFPEGWTPSPDAITFGSMKTDIFTAPDDGSGAGTTAIVIQCSELEPLPSQSEWSTTRADTYRALGAVDLRDAGHVPVSGADATIYEYTVVTEKGTVKKTDLVFIGGRCAWVVSLGVPESADTVSARSVFEAFYRSFRLI